VKKIFGPRWLQSRKKLNYENTYADRLSPGKETKNQKQTRMSNIAALQKMCTEYKKEHDDFAEMVAATFTEAGKVEWLAEQKTGWPSYRSWKWEIDQAKMEGRMWDNWKKTNVDKLAAKRSAMEAADLLLEKEKHCERYAEVTLYGQAALAGWYAVTRTPTHYEFVMRKASFGVGEQHLFKTFTVPLTAAMGVGEYVNVVEEKIRVAE